MSFRDCIVTDRLILRHFDEGDVEDVFALMSDDYICKWIGTRPFTSVAQAASFRPLVWLGTDLRLVIGFLRSTVDWVI